MNEYYSELFGHGDPVIAAGWRHRLEQALRYEIALESIDLAAEPADRSLKILDVGCGPGNLWNYLNAMGARIAGKVDYTGIDRLQAAVDLARERFPAAKFSHQNLFTFEKRQDSQSFDAVFAIGTMVSGVELGNDSERLLRLEKLIEHSFLLSRSVFCLVVLDQRVVEERFVLRSESALLGAHSAELHAIGQRLAKAHSSNYAVRENFLTTDIALYLWREGASAPVFLTQDEQYLPHERVLAGPWGQDIDPLDRAWLWMEAGAYERADLILNAEPGPVGEYADLMRLRLEFAYSEGAG